MDTRTDCELIMEVLKDGQPHHAVEICERCKPGRVNWTLRSRVSNLRLLKHENIINLREAQENVTGIPVPEYIIQRYGRKDKEAVYQLLPDHVTQTQMNFTESAAATTGTI